jgi:hypothetical protein
MNPLRDTAGPLPRNQGVKEALRALETGSDLKNNYP